MKIVIKIILRIIVSLLLALILAFLESVTIFRHQFEFSPKEDLDLSIIALAEKGNISGGTEVRIESILADDDPVDLVELADKSEIWNMDGSWLGAYRLEQPAALNVHLEEARRVKVSFIGQTGSGLVQIDCQGKSDQIDLYYDGWNRVSWVYETNPIYAPQNNIPLFVWMWVAATIAFLLAGLHRAE